MKILKILGAIALAFLGLIAAAWWALKPHQPSDASLERRFNKERPQLERLVSMMTQDWNMARVTPGFTWRQDNLAWPRPESEWGISKDRWDEYRRVFRETGVSDGVTRPEKSSDILLDVWSWGLVVGGTSVSYAYCGPPREGTTHTEPPCLEQAESGSGKNLGGGLAYRYKRVSRDWYIYEEDN